MRPLVALLTVLVPVVAIAADPVDLPAGAFARLGGTGYQGHAALSPDGKRLVVADNDTTRVFELPSGKLLRHLELPKDADGKRTARVYKPRFLDDRRLVAKGRSAYNVLFIWDVDTGQLELDLRITNPDYPKEAPEGIGVHAGFVFPDGKRMVAARSRNGKPPQYEVWDTRPLKKVLTADGLHDYDGWAKLSADGSTLICGGFGTGKVKPDPRPLVQVIDVATGKERARINVGDSSKAHAFDVSPDGKRVAGGVADNLRVWDATTGKQVWAAAEKGTDSDLVQFDRSGTRLTVAGGAGVRVYDAGSGKRVGEYAWPYPNPYPDAVAYGTRVEFPPGGTPLVLSPRGETVEVWELETGKLLLPQSGHACPISALGFTPDGKTLHSVDAAAHHQSWDVATRTASARTPRLLKPNQGSGVRPRVGVSGAAGRVAVAHSDWFEAGTWDLGTGKRLARTEIDADPEREVWYDVLPTFSPDGGLFALQPRVDPNSHEPAVDFDFAVRDAATGKTTFRVKQQEVSGVSAAFTPDGGLVLASHHPKREGDKLELALWDLKTRKRLHAATLDAGPADAAATADGQRAVVVHGRDPVRLAVWDLGSGVVGRPVATRWHSSAAPPVVSPDGRWFALITVDKEGRAGVVRVVETASLNERAVLPLHPAAVAVSPDGNTLAAGMHDGTVLLFDVSHAAGPKPWEKAATDPAELWKRLADPDAAKGWAAVRELVHRPDAAVALFRKEVRPLVPADRPKPERLKAWVEQLAAKDFREREAASAELRRVGRLVEPEVRQAMKEVESPEAQERLTAVVSRLTAVTPEEAREARAVEVLEAIRTAEARTLLEDWAKADPRTVLHREAAAAGTRVAGRGGK